MNKTSIQLLLICSFLLLSGGFVYGQIPVQEEKKPVLVEGDSSKLIVREQGIEQKDSLILDKHSPRKASLYSAVLPGLGQAYNKKYWKIPVVYVGFGAMTYFFVRNNNRYQGFKRALITRTDGDENTVDAYATQYPNQASLVEYKDYYRRNRDLSVIGFSLLYILNVVDANVDANLYYFDVSDDLSLHWSPILPAGPGSVSGLCLQLKF